MKIGMPFLLSVIVFISCNNNPESDTKNPTRIPIKGTWKLLTGTLIEKGDTVITTYSKNKSFIKIINDTHFAFLEHDLNKGKDTAVVYSSGGGRYSLQDSIYTEHLEYCSDREWEGNDFTFTITINNDTLIQSGIEKVEKTGVNRMNTEKYIRVK